MAEDIWRDEYNVGCDYVDAAHRKLFVTLRKVENLIREKNYDKDKFACVEGIKFLENYAETHFAQEEAFMRETGYKGYEQHKKLHDELKDDTIPELQKSLDESDYSKEAVSEFLAVFTGWLASHILIEDLAITGKAISRYNLDENISKLDNLKKEIQRILNDFTGGEPSLISDNYEGVNIPKAQYYEMSFEKVKVVFVAQDSLILGMISAMIGVKVTAMDKDILMTFVQMVNSLVKPALIIYSPSDLDKTSAKKIINVETLQQYFKDDKVLCSIGWDTRFGKAALCIFEK